MESQTWLLAANLGACGGPSIGRDGSLRTGGPADGAAVDKTYRLDPSLSFGPGAFPR